MGFKIVGIVGSIACGKGVVAEYLIKKYNYVSFSLSSLIHEEAQKRGITVFTRTTLQDMGDEMRRREGDGVLAKRAIEKLKVGNNDRRSVQVQKIIIEGIRNPGEVAYLRTIPGFFLIAVDATKEIRFQRVLAREKAWDPKDWETFLKVDGRDSMDKTNTNGQQVRACMEMADIRIENNGSINELMSNLKKILLSRRPLHTGR